MPRLIAVHPYPEPRMPHGDPLTDALDNHDAEWEIFAAASLADMLVPWEPSGLSTPDVWGPTPRGRGSVTA